MPVLPLASGLLAGALALLQMLCWASLGLHLLPRILPRALTLAVAIVLGAGINSLLLAVTTRMGFVAGGATASAVLSLGALCVGYSYLAECMRSLIAEVRTRVPGYRLLRWLAPVLVFYWINGIAPPRDGDVVRYHLAHIRQIIIDGGWKPIADYHYAFPFGWSLNFLPFELIGLPEVAHLLSALLMLLSLVALVALLSGLTSLEVALPLAGLAAFHPAIVKAGTTAFADAYAVYVVTVAAAVLRHIHGTMVRAADRNDEANRRVLRSAAMMLGFVVWVGMQSRYQLVGFGIAATTAFALEVLPSRKRYLLVHFLAGSAVAVVLAAPFYLANLETFGNPVWPMLVSVFNREPGYADIVASAYHASQTGSLSIPGIGSSAARLLSTLHIVPWPQLLIVVIAVAAVKSRMRSQPIFILTATFALLWVLAQPALYNRFVLYFIPLIVLCCGLIVAGQSARIRSAVRASALSASVVLAVASLVYSRDNIAYAGTGDTARFHRYTWYYRVYQWVNRNVSADSKFMVIVWSGHSYYLERPYRRADPWLSGEVDWQRVTSTAQLDSVLATGGYSHVIYENRDWRRFAGGANMMRQMSDAIASGILIPRRAFRERLYDRRLGRRWVETTVHILDYRGNGSLGAGRKASLTARQATEP